MTETANLFFLGAAGGVEWGTVIVQVLTFIVLLALLKKFAWGPLKDVMDKRERDINRDIDDAKQAKLNAQKHEEENKQKLKETQEEVQKILEDAKAQARQHQEQIIHEANVRANGRIETAQSEINSQKERAIAEINKQVSE
ncbi:F0F1 ATP synthase subunit B, partial [Escherichia coli]|nr:F0F1 ATP synthase subunit B [Escherichia coli]